MRMLTSETENKFMKKILVFAITLFAGNQGFTQGTLVYDQQSASNGLASGGAPMQIQQPMGQSFTPSLSAVGFVQFQFDNTSGSLGATVYVKLLENSITGNVVAASNPVFIRSHFLGTTNFFFTSNVSIQAGVEYFFLPVLQSGDNVNLLSDFYNYTGGAAYYSGIPRTDGRDFWFREGIVVVPEPATGSLLLVGAAAAMMLQQRRRHIY